MMRFVGDNGIEIILAERSSLDCLISLLDPTVIRNQLP